uniref:Protein lsm12 n=1 Tax=Echinococcus granulosus TaxID=6210 RepID=A0A068WIA0_ECHGR|nr:protein lsm12 [Echinococcus granulosus]
MWKGVRPGVYVEFTMDDGENLDGEVLYSDDNQKFFMFQRPAKSGRQDSYDVYFYRHENVKEIRIIKPNASFSYPELDLEKVTARSNRNERQEQERMKLFEPDVPKEVRNLFEHLSKTLPGEAQLSVRWVKPDIHVLEQTVIKPPYSAESVQERSESVKAKSERDYVRKLFYSERSSDS